MKYLLIFSVSILMVACTKKAVSQHNSMNSLDWAGVYAGSVTIDKKSQTVSLKLNEDLTYHLTLGNEKFDGDFIWTPDGGSITLPDLKTPLYFLVGENYLLPTDKKGKELKGSLGQLVKSDDISIKEKYWKLIEIKGKPVKLKEGQREPHLILKLDDSKVIGFGGCNTFTGSYEVDEKQGKIKFSKVASTLMACSDENVEREFYQIFDQVDNFTSDGTNLSLNKARMAPLARFEVVYLK